MLSPMTAPHDLIPGLAPHVATELESHLEASVLVGGATLFEAGDEPDGMAVIRRGRLAVLNDDGDVMEVFGSGEVIGEIGALTGAQRTRTVVATRDTELLVMSQEVFEGLATAHPTLVRELSRLVVDRLTSPDADDAGTRVPSTVALVTADESIDTTPLVDAFARIADGVSIMRAADVKGKTNAQRLSQLDARERDNGLTVLDVGQVDDDPAWTEWCTRQADEVLVVVSATAANAPRALRDYAVALEDARCPLELVVVNPASSSFPVDATALRRALRADRVHHIKTADVLSADRLARLLLGEGVGLTLSGGGAKGLAHIGAWRAISELGVDVDAVSGVSFGALMAAGIALDYTADELHEMVTSRLIEQRSIFDPTLPVVALLRGAGVSDELKDVGEGRTFDQVWRPFLCSSCDLVSGSLVDHTEGPLWRAVRSSLSIPGVFPPVRSGDQLLVDGAVRDNLPVQSLRNAHPTPLKVIAVDVGGEGGLDAGRAPVDGTVSGWGQLRGRLLRRRRSDVPHLGQIMMRVVELAGSDAAGDADIVIKPDLSGLGIADLGEMKRFEQAGYEAAVQALS